METKEFADRFKDMAHEYKDKFAEAMGICRDQQRLINKKDAEIARLTEERDALRGFARSILDDPCLSWGQIKIAHRWGLTSDIDKPVPTPLLTGEETGE